MRSTATSGNVLMESDIPIKTSPITAGVSMAVMDVAGTDVPYIERSRRRMLRPVAEDSPQTAGELNYQMSQLVVRYLAMNQGYQGINDVVGVLECLKMEVYRRLAVPYENGKKQQNGDVF